MNLRRMLLSTLTVYLLIVPTNQDCYCPMLRWLMCTNIVDITQPEVCGNVTRINILESSIPDLKYGLFKNYTNLMMISMPGNNITSIAEDAFNNLSRLDTLDLSNNFIRIVPGDMFNKLYSLRRLILSKNKIVSVKPLLKDCGDIMEINLSFNNISQIQLSEGCARLKTLIISGNHLTEFGINRTNSITMLLLSENNLNNIHKVSLKNLDQLTLLYLSHNPLFHTHDVPVNLFQNKTSLIDLDLAATGIRNLTAGVFKGLRRLRNLNLSSNYLEYLPESIFYGLNDLHDFDISNNRFTVWQVENYPRFSSINLDGNLWSCVTLSDIIKKYKSMDTRIVPGQTYSSLNILGVGCIDSKNSVCRIKVKMGITRFKCDILTN